MLKLARTPDVICEAWERDRPRTVSHRLQLSIMRLLSLFRREFVKIRLSCEEKKIQDSEGVGNETYRPCLLFPLISSAERNLEKLSKEITDKKTPIKDHIFFPYFAS